MAVLRHEEYAAGDGLRRMGGSKRLAVEFKIAAVDRIDAEHGAGELRPAGADEAGKAEYFAIAHVKAYRLRGIGAGPDADG